MKKNPNQSLSKEAQVENDATEYLRKAMNFSVGHPERHFCIGMACMVLMCCEEAIAAFKKVLSIDPNHAAAWEKIRFACGSVGYYNEEMIEMCTQIIHHNYQHVSANTFLGECYHKVGLRDKAIPLLRKATVFHPEAPSPHLILGEIYAELGDRDSAMEEYERLARLDKNGAGTLLHFINSKSYLKSNKTSITF